IEGSDQIGVAVANGQKPSPSRFAALVVGRNPGIPRHFGAIDRGRALVPKPAALARFQHLDFGMRKLTGVEALAARFRLLLEGVPKMSRIGTSGLSVVFGPSATGRPSRASGPPERASLRMAVRSPLVRCPIFSPQFVRDGVGGSSAIIACR